MKQTKRLFSKRPKLSKREAQNLEFLQAEKDIVLAVNIINDELKQTNTLIEDVVGEMKKKKRGSVKNFEYSSRSATIARK